MMYPVYGCPAVGAGMIITSWGKRRGTNNQMPYNSGLGSQSKTYSRNSEAAQTNRNRNRDGRIRHYFLASWSFDSFAEEEW